MNIYKLYNLICESCESIYILFNKKNKNKTINEFIDLELGSGYPKNHMPYIKYQKKNHNIHNNTILEFENVDDYGFYVFLEE
jgi:hypothetical protein